MRRVFLAMALCAVGHQAAALSCQRIEPQDAFEKAAAAEESYIVVHGSFAFDAEALPKSHEPGAGDVTIPATFTGLGLTGEGFSTPLEFRVALDARCLGPWCGTLQPDLLQLAFLERRTDGYHLEVSPCPGRAFSTPDEATLDQMTACLNGGC
ncbi:hypothetical protein [Oceaniglobus trochenteri]|uniref:hypothetical protein n=1 Tax=Oceaniglobus trochenteri TaxID=2763260 RepID=UPI001D001517|nr:hypothetical protein [Oceaniglobus trochenteri]